MGKFILVSSGFLIFASISYEIIQKDIVIAALFAIILIIATAVKLASGSKRVHPVITDLKEGRKIVLSAAIDGPSDRKYLVNTKKPLFPDN